MKRAVLVAVPIALLVACADHEVTQPRTPLSAALFDGSQGGNPNFFFLPPVAPNPVDHITRGAFDPAAPPTITVYKLPPTPPATCTGLGPAVFGPVTATLVASEEHYLAVWNTLLNPPEANEFYRICAFAANGGVELGFVDVDPVQGGMKNVRTQEFFEFQNGREVPIKTRVQFCANASVDCTTQLVDAEQGGTVLADEASVFFPPNVLPADRVVVIEEIVLGEGETCLDRSDLIERGPCYQFRTIPGPTPFNGFAIAAICPLNNLTGMDRFRQLFQEEFADPLADARPTTDQEGVCLSTDISVLDQAGLGGLAAAWRRVMRHIAGLFGTRPLFAATIINQGAAGSTPGFSRFVNAIRPQLVKLDEGDNQEGLVGSTLRIEPSVRVEATHAEENPDDPPPHGLGGIPVTFTFRDPAGIVTGEVTVFTDVETGIASTSWTLGSTTGEYRLEVAAAGFMGGPATFTATAFAPTLAVDQANDPETGTSFSCFFTGNALYQSFTPALSPLAAVELRLRVGLDFPASGVRTSIRIRDGSPTGGELGIATASIPGPQTGGTLLLVPFTFSEPIPVTTGEPLVIEWLSPAPGGVNAGTILSWMGLDSNPYAGGTMFDCDQAATAGVDLNFRTFSPTVPSIP